MQLSTHKDGDNEILHLPVEDIMCCVCHEFKTGNWSGKCGHILCTTCKRTLARDSTVKCPVCETRSNWYENHFVNRIIGNQQVKCEYGCDTKITVRAFAEHYKTCPKRSVPCKYPHCDWTGTFESQDRHLAECDFVPAKCNWCDTYIPVGALESHNRQCYMAKGECQCGYSDFIWRLERHKCGKIDVQNDTIITKCCQYCIRFKGQRKYDFEAMKQQEAPGRIYACKCCSTYWFGPPEKTPCSSERCKYSIALGQNPDICPNVGVYCQECDGWTVARL